MDDTKYVIGQWIVDIKQLNICKIYEILLEDCALVFDVWIVLKDLQANIIFAVFVCFWVAEITWNPTKYTDNNNDKRIMCVFTMHIFKWFFVGFICWWCTKFDLEFYAILQMFEYFILTNSNQILLLCFLTILLSLRGNCIELI